MTSLYRLLIGKIFIIAGLISPIFAASAQSINQNWKHDLTASLQQFLQCTSSAPNSKPCTSYTAESLHTVYKINDFYSSQNKRHMTTNEIANFLKSSDKWEVLGQSYDQKTLTTAQEHANAKKAVVAVYLNSAGVGHVVIITPGELKPSGSWGLSVPSAASFFPIEPEKSFVDKNLSYAFMKQMLKDVVIYGRKY